RPVLSFPSRTGRRWRPAATRRRGFAMASNGSKYIFAGAAHQTGPGGERYRGGLFRLSPGECVWPAGNAGLPESVEARAFAVHPREPNVIYAGTQDGPYRSLDAGNRWERVGFPERNVVIWSLAFHPSDPKVLFAGSAPVGVYRSDDGGEHW